MGVRFIAILATVFINAMKGTALLIFSFLLSYAQAQVSVKDSIIGFPTIGVSYSYQIPGGDLAKRFGNNSSLGATALYKNKHNLIYGIEGTFIFGSILRESGILDSISTRRVQSIIVDQNGEAADVRLSERGFTVSAVVGKIIPLWSPNPNSGIMIQAKIGYLQHQIRIEDYNGNTIQITGDYVKGYDRLTSGWAVSEFLGYQYLGNRRLLNFFAGVEFIQGFTKSQRYDFDLRRSDQSQHKDYLFGLRAGWIFPLYKKTPKEFYYY